MDILKLLATLVSLLLVGGCGTFAGTDIGEDEDNGGSNSSSTKYEVKVTESNGLYLQGEEDDDDAEDDSDDDSSDDDDAVEEPSDDDIAACNEIFGEDVEVVSVSGSEETVALEAGNVLAVRITGNQNSVNVTVNPAEGEVDAGMKGMCFFMAGNQASASVDATDFEMDTFVWVARGNSPTAALTVGEGAKVGEIIADAKGNGATLSISGAGDYECPDDDDLKGKAVEIDCQ